MAAGPVFLSGEISKTLEIGGGCNFFDLGITFSNHPSWIFGISPGDLSSYNFNPTPQEEQIMVDYKIKENNEYKSIEEINIGIWRPGVFLELQPFIKDNQIIYPFLRITFSENRFSNSLPEKGYVERETKWGPGLNLKLGADFRIDDGITFRLGYSYGYLFNPKMNLLPGLRQINGGASHMVYFALGFNFNKDW
jgi:hypothetical protein